MLHTCYMELAPSVSQSPRALHASTSIPLSCYSITWSEHFSLLQDCGKPWYVENYIAFFTAIRSKYPHMRLISNCDMTDHAPTDLFDWHMYTDPQNMFDRRHDFDNMPNLQDKQIFASEFGVVSDSPGTPIPFPGNARVS